MPGYASFTLNSTTHINTAIDANSYTDAPRLTSTNPFSMNFAPYQDDSPEANRSSHFPLPAPSPQPDAHNPYAAPRESLPSPEDFETRVGGSGAPTPTTGFGNTTERNVDVFSTSLPMRLDYEACLPYLLLPPAGGALLLVLERKSDYVRFHAWQSSLLFGFLFLLHLILSFSKVLSWMLFVVDLGLIGWLTFHAHRDADTLDRCEVPFFGRLASSFVDEE